MSREEHIQQLPSVSSDSGETCGDNTQTLPLIPSSPPHNVPPLDPRLNPNPTKDHSHSQPLTFTQAMFENDDTKQHREELSRDCYHDEGETSEMLNDLEDE